MNELSLNSQLGQNHPDGGKHDPSPDDIYGLCQHPKSLYESLMDGAENSKEVEPLELHVDAKNFKFQIVFFSFFWLLAASLGTAYLSSNGAFVLRAAFALACLWFIAVLTTVIYDAYRGTLTKGAIFSFSKHGMIDHRLKNPKIYRW